MKSYAGFRKVIGLKGPEIEKLTGYTKLRKFRKRQKLMRRE
ncbi:hypothetical protein [Clostridium magnum]|uniref:Uncharacterized protein n=1 Tax=Clostridium magnum DSM 2767 TaxID=1121326 RepID=A0A162QLJ4_9CLOT|nr:hypothetical protein [Clostridium magnum]KZL88677.1 hypothetical protein CLMAG_59660 [Clostridium magnum DSM 2767]SHJ60735.1 hypothetical protein SAMN02745944_06227 [Clostridium magnum DSM 2767]